MYICPLYVANYAEHSIHTHAQARIQNTTQLFPFYSFAGTYGLSDIIADFLNPYRAELVLLLLHLLTAYTSPPKSKPFSKAVWYALAGA